MLSATWNIPASDEGWEGESKNDVKISPKGAPHCFRDPFVDVCSDDGMMMEPLFQQ